MSSREGLAGQGVVTRLLESWLGNGGKPIKTAKGPRYQVRWRLLADGASRPKECKCTDFLTKANYFLEELEKTHHGVVGPDGRSWRFDAGGRPTNLRDADTTGIGAIELSVRNRWFSEW